jgi:ubiquinone/menaquinone biosynthesis C-methylase UbiE
VAPLQESLTLSLQNILDLGSGPGGWALDAAFALPDAEVEGVDVSRTMVDYANARARTQQLPNASFGVMDLAQPLEFPDASFDLVNGRYLFPVLKRDAWSPFLSECMRVLRPGGILRLSESLNFGNTSSTAFNRLGSLIMQAFCQDGYGFSPDGLTFGVDHILPTLMRQQGYQSVQLTAHAIDFTAFLTDTYHNVEIIGYQVKPRLLKHDLITPDDFDQLLQQTLIDILSASFCGQGYLLTVLGHKPSAS